MPVAVVQEWLREGNDRSHTTYAALHERITESGPIEGFLPHAAGFTGHGFRIFEVWESREQFDRFVEERLLAVRREIAPSDARQPELTVYELHGFVVAPQDAE